MKGSLKSANALGIDWKGKGEEEGRGGEGEWGAAAWDCSIRRPWGRRELTDWTLDGLDGPFG